MSGDLRISSSKEHSIFCNVGLSAQWNIIGLFGDTVNFTFLGDISLGLVTSLNFVFLYRPLYVVIYKKIVCVLYIY